MNGETARNITLRSTKYSAIISGEEKKRTGTNTDDYNEQVETPIAAAPSKSPRHSSDFSLDMTNVWHEERAKICST